LSLGKAAGYSHQLSVQLKFVAHSDVRIRDGGKIICWGERILFAASGSPCWHGVNSSRWGSNAMQTIAIHRAAILRIWKNTCLQTCLLLSVFVVCSYPAIAKHHFRHGDRTTTSHSRITCETVRTYVAQVGLEQAKAMAQAAGMTEAEEREAAQCLEKKI
jgi:hypothetical protein